MVHRQRRDAVAGLDAEPLERLGHAPGIVGDALPVGPDGRSVGPGGDDLARAMLALGMVDQPHDPQRKILHCAELSPAPPLSSQGGIMAAKIRRCEQAI